MKTRINFNIFIIFITLAICVIAESKTVQEYMQEAGHYYRNGNEEMADKVMKEALEKYPTNKYTLRYKGMKLLNLSRREEAYEVFKDAVKYNPDYGEGYWFIGTFERDLGNITKAEEYFRKAVDVDPTCQAHGDLGGLYYDQGKYEEAVKELNLYLEHNEHTEEVYLVLGEAYAKLGKYEEAINAYQKGREIGDPRNPVLLLKIGKAYEKLEQWENAARIYKLANRWHSYDEEVRELLKRAEKMSAEHPAKIKEPTLDYKGYKPSEDQTTEHK